ncbi:methionyl-tRNA formyltransferase [Anaerobium acetethylicum]|uniref:Methionyl-tRNA formyltransferase n=1 Tax=Anaerobium acetethylicum TaxID=1619234 RepID=A0A1D3TV93_9FIRM|nr:methionyl-tRNA formyltransferase [Anaerobium acetethylicum]SCP98051.1 methionyl-tRNA formyltransferase [Anaerobium acetethylicum]
MKIVFMGTPDFSVGTLEKLIEAGHEVLAVITQPDKPKGRGKAMQHTPVKEAALRHGIPVYQPVKVREPEFIEILKGLNPEVIVVVAFGQILPKSILEMPKYGCVNVHASLLPKYRGAAPINWSIIDGEEVTGVTTMKMDVGLDTGDMIMKTAVTIEKDETAGSLHDKLSMAGALLCVETLRKLEDGTAVFEKQDDSLSNYAKMLDKNLGKIDWRNDAAYIERLIRGLNPWPSAYSSFEGKTLKIWAAEVIEDEADGKAGEIVAVTKNGIQVKTGKGILEIRELQLEGKKRMEAGAFLRGYPVAIGTILG